MTEQVIKKRTIFLALILVLATVAYAFYTTSKSNILEFHYARMSYLIIFLLFLSWIYQWTNFLSEKQELIKISWKELAVGGSVSFLLAVYVFVSVDPQLRVVIDESNFLAVANNMVNGRRVDLPSMGLINESGFYPIAFQPSVRPLFFPFLIHLIHLVLGIRVENVFILNFLLLTGTYFLTFHFVRKLLGLGYAFASLLLLSAQPLIAHAATSGGVDLFSHFLFMIVILCVAFHLDAPSRRTFALLWMSLLVYAHTRHESVILAALIMTLLILLKKISFSNLKSPWLWGFTPLLLIPL